jgi:hypothetical protein
MRTMKGTLIPGTSVSVWRRAQEDYAWLQDGNVRATDNLNVGNTAGDASRWIVYRPDENNFFIEHTDTMVFGPFQEGMEVWFVSLRRIGGVISKRPEIAMSLDFTT